MADNQIGDVIVEGTVLEDPQAVQQIAAVYNKLRDDEGAPADEEEVVLVLQPMTRTQMREFTRLWSRVGRERELVQALADRMANAPELPDSAATHATVEADLAWRELEDRYGKSFTAAEVARRAGSTNKNPSEWATLRARTHRLLAVRRAGRDWFPRFQFNPNTGQPLEGLADILAVFAKAEWSPASVAVWMAEPRGETDGQRPADLLATAPQRILLGAQMATDPW